MVVWAITFWIYQQKQKQQKQKWTREILSNKNAFSKKKNASAKQKEEPTDKKGKPQNGGNIFKPCIS